MDVADLITSQGLDLSRVSGGRELILTCTFCDRPKLYVNATTGLWICQRCGERGNLWTLATKILELDNYDAFRLTREVEKGLKDAPRFIQKIEREPEEEISLPDGFRRLAHRGNPVDEPYWHYLTFQGFDERGTFCRGLSEAEVKAYDIGAVTYSGPYARRAIIPVRVDGQLRSFVARSIRDVCPACRREPCDCRARWRKVLHPEVQMAKLLFNIDRMKDGQEIVLMEGVFDALRLPDQAVCSFGAHLSREQRALIRKRTDKAIICWDGDDVGRAGAVRVAKELVSDLIRVRIAQLPNGTDPGSVDPDTLSARIHDAIPFDLMSPKGLTSPTLRV